MRGPHDTGIHVEEGTLHGAANTVVIARVVVTTQWRCPSCRTGWSKRGRHSGTRHTCRRCGAQFWIRDG